MACCESCEHGGTCEGNKTMQAKQGARVGAFSNNPAPARSIGAKRSTRPAGPGIGAAPESTRTPKGTCEMGCSNLFSYGSQAWHDCIAGCSVLQRSATPHRATVAVQGTAQRNAARLATAKLGTRRKMQPRKGKCVDGTWCPTRFCHCDCNADLTKCRRVWYR